MADLFTKYLKRDDIDRLLFAMGMTLESGRSDIGLKISAVVSDGISNQVRSMEEDSTVDSWIDLRGNRSPCGTRHLSSCQPFEPRLYQPSVDGVKSLHAELCGNSRWIRVHGLYRYGLFLPMGLKDGPSQRCHVPNFRISVLRYSDQDQPVVIVDHWKEKNFTVDKGFKGWTAFVSYIPKALDEFRFNDCVRV